MTNTITCPECGNEVGRTVEINGQEWLSVNGIAVRSMHGVCLNCSAQFHWSVNEQMLSEMINKVMSMRSEGH
jgi:hypothetical protein